MNTIAKNTATIAALFTILTAAGMLATGEFAAVGGVCYSDADCSNGYFCEFTNYGCEPPGVCTIVPDDCDVRYRPVCGCDDRVYDSDCERRQSKESKADYDDTDDKIICCNPADPVPLKCGDDGNVYWHNYCDIGSGKEYYRGAWRFFNRVLVEECPEDCENGVCVSELPPPPPPPPPTCTEGDVMVTENHTCAGTGEVITECTKTCLSTGSWGVEECVENPEEQCGAVDVWDRVLNHWKRTLAGIPYGVLYLAGAVGLVGIINYKRK